MKKITNKTRVSILVFFLIIVALFYFYKHPTVKQDSAYKCPENYTEDDAGTTEYRNALIDWTSEFFKANPKATSSDWSIAKLKLLENNKCVIALQRLKMSGKVVDLKPWELIDYEVQNRLDKAISGTN
jgi:hypothetical protein